MGVGGYLNRRSGEAGSEAERSTTSSTATAAAARSASGELRRPAVAIRGEGGGEGWGGGAGREVGRVGAASRGRSGGVEVARRRGVAWGLG